ncbi:MAG: hypothetical protein H6719_07415 [Sandaracinaceae bacterium]|nr:hypothetical protein [Sandaracinaceae bacterium]
MRIGTMFLGRVDALEGESIQTKFFILGVPLAPMSSYYVIRDLGNGVDGFELPMVHGKSVLLGYLRMLSAIGAVLGGVFAYIERGDSVGLWVACVVCTALWAASMFVLGGITPEEKAQRLALRRWAGVGAPPELLDGERRDAIQAILERSWARLCEELGAEQARDWRPLLATPSRAPAGSEELLYALARYEGEGERADAIWRHARA